MYYFVKDGIKLIENKKSCCQSFLVTVNSCVTSIQCVMCEWVGVGDAFVCVGKVCCSSHLACQWTGCSWGW